MKAAALQHTHREFLHVSIPFTCEIHFLCLVFILKPAFVGFKATVSNVITIIEWASSVFISLKGEAEKLSRSALNLHFYY